MKTTASVVGIVIALALTVATAWAERPVSYLVQSVGPVQVTLGAPEAVKCTSVGSVTGGWRQVSDAWADGRLSISLTGEDLRSGAAVIVLDPPEWLDMTDNEPPVVQRLAVDGVTYDVPQVSLGWLPAPPVKITMEVRDKRNRLDQGSVLVQWQNRQLRPGDAGVSVTSKGPRHARIEFIPAQAGLSDEGGSASVILSVDDTALDLVQARREVTWSLSPAITLDDGTRVTVDSSSEDEGWRDWQVIFDGSPMRDDETTTRDRTWLSADHETEHWIRFDFPEPRAVDGIDLYWAYYQVWRTSVAYDVQTWDGEAWVTQVPVRDQAEAGKSEHRFAPTKTTALRVLQPALSGHPGRAGYLWLSEVELSQR